MGLAFATAFTLRAAKPCRPFPSGDDFAYIPLAWAAYNPALYPRDVLVQQYQVLNNAPLWGLLVKGAESTIGLMWGFWVLTIALTVASVLAVHRLMRSAGATGYLLPIAVAFAFASRVGGLGRGAVEGAFGDGVHIQWVAVCALLWCYGIFATGRHLATGVLLGVVFLAHPQIGLHGTFALTIATLASSRDVRGLLLTTIVAACLATPVMIPLTRSLLEEGRAIGGNNTDLINLVYLFRLPNEYTFSGTTTFDAMLFAGKGLIGIAGVLWLRRIDQSPRSRMLVGVFLGHVILLLAATIQMGGLGPRIWGESLAPYLLGLSRTTPLFLVLGGTLTVVAVERSLGQWSVPARLQCIVVVSRRVQAGLLSKSRRLICMTMLLGVVGLSLLASRNNTTAGKFAYIAPVILGAVAWRRASRGEALGAELIVAIGVTATCLGWIVASPPRAAVLKPEKAGLFSWSRQSTPDSSLFIVPPGLEEFRLYTRRSVYVDVKLFSPAVPGAGLLWRQRLEEVAAPDAATLKYRGWPGMMGVWDRSYAEYNSPERIVWLLGKTGADFFVRDASPAARPITPEALSSVGLRTAYRNGRYEVYMLGSRR